MGSNFAKMSFPNLALTAFTRTAYFQKSQSVKTNPNTGGGIFYPPLNYSNTLYPSRDKNCFFEFSAWG
jgi:hypothetical protein